MSVVFLSIGKVVMLHKKLEDVKKEAERCVILKINQLHPHISLAASTIDVYMPSVQQVWKLTRTVIGLWK